MGSKKILGQKNVWVKKILGKNFFWSYRFGFENFFLSKKAGTVKPRGKTFGPPPPKKIVGLKLCWVVVSFVR